MEGHVAFDFRDDLVDVTVVDNGSTDNTGEAARSAGGQVVNESRRGYGYACAAGVAAAASETSKPDADAGPMGYFVDSLFRNGTNVQQGSSVPQNDTPPPTAEVGRIFASNAGADSLPAQDVHYLGQVVAQRTGMAQQEAEQRVVDTYAAMQAKLRDAATATKVAADTARKASSYAALWLFISLLLGAFVASLAATLGGRQRDL